MDEDQPTVSSVLREAGVFFFDEKSRLVALAVKEVVAGRDSGELLDLAQETDVTRRLVEGLLRRLAQI